MWPLCHHVLLLALWSTKCGPRTSSTSSSWELVRNVNVWAILGPTDSETEGQSSKLCYKQPQGNSEDYSRPLVRGLWIQGDCHWGKRIHAQEVKSSVLYCERLIHFPSQYPASTKDMLPFNKSKSFTFSLQLRTFTFTLLFFGYHMLVGMQVVTKRRTGKHWVDHTRI
jgi:hypothetical protein